jgi:hypothetical protein
MRSNEISRAATVLKSVGMGPIAGGLLEIEAKALFASGIEPERAGQLRLAARPSAVLS